jgi:long-chain acyl-CoA synthetase
MKKLHEEIIEAFEARISRNPAGNGGTAILQYDTVISYAELLREAAGIATALKDAGVPPASFARIAVLGSDSAGYVALALGILMADGVLISAGAETPASEFSELINRTAADFAVIEYELLDRDIGFDTLPKRKKRTLTAFSAKFAVFKKDDFSAEDGAAPPPLPNETAFRALNPAFIRFSSGTTGDSKGVALSHDTIIERTEAANSAFNLDENDTVLWMLPMAHHFAATIMLFLREGCAIDIAVDAPPEKLLAKLADGSATFVYATPHHYAKLAAAADKAKDTCGISPRVKLLITTAMPLSMEISEHFSTLFGRHLNQAYGIIECGLPCVNVDPRSAEDALSVGTPTKGFRVSADGELLLQGPGFFDAYISPWTPREEVLDDDGWFHTGDLGRRDDEGRIHITGRLKSVINFLGLKIFPEKVEAELNAHPEIRESRVSGVPHKDYGEIPVAEFVPENETLIPNPVELTRFCSAKLAVHEIPQEFTPVESIPKTPNGKIIR